MSLLPLTVCSIGIDRSGFIPTSVYFVAGYNRGEYKGASQAAAYERGPGFEWHYRYQRASAAQDWAVIELADPIDLKPISVLLEGETTGPSTKVVAAGYRGDRAHVLTIQHQCTATASKLAPFVLHSCNSVRGQSGSPLLSFKEGEPQIVGIVVATSNNQQPTLSVALLSTTFAAAVQRVLRHSP